MAAKLSPCLMSVRHDAGLYRELDVLERLQLSLPDGYEIFHSVNWHTIHHGSDVYGEIDVVVLGPSGNMLLIEVKAGDAILRDGQLYKLYDGHERDITKQSQVQYAAMRNRLSAAKLDSHVDHCLVLPDYNVDDTHIVSTPRERIIGAGEYDTLGRRVRELIPTTSCRSDVEAVRRFLANEFKVSPDLRVLGDQLRKTSRQLSDGLATWVPRIEAPSGAIRIQATAGSGKTQLALRLLEDAATEGKRALYVCFNRTLADHIGRIAPARAKVTSFHELCVAHYRQAVGEPDFSATGIFDVVAEVYCRDAGESALRYDLIVVDEGQDFEPAWVAGLLAQLNDDGRFYLLEDEAQRLYKRDDFDLNGAVTLTCRDNFRSPAMIVNVINALGLASCPIDSRSPFAGELPEFRRYSSERELAHQTAQAVQSLISRGVAVENIAVLTGRGHANSSILRKNQLGDFTVRRFTGQYSVDGEPIHTDGNLLLESIYRFKGQSADGIVLTEFDFETLDDPVRRKLFVGMTRAHLAVELVLSAQADSALERVLLR